MIGAYQTLIRRAPPDTFSREEKGAPFVRAHFLIRGSDTSVGCFVPNSLEQGLRLALNIVHRGLGIGLPDQHGVDGAADQIL